MPARWAAALFGGWMAVLAVLFVLVPLGAQTPVRLLAGLTAVVVVTVGVRRNRPAHRFPWRMLSTGLVLSVLGTAMFRAPDWAHSVLPDLVDVGSLLVLVSYPVFAIMLMAFLRRRAGNPRDRAALLDSLTVTAGVALLTWSFMIGPNLRGAVGETWQQIAFPLSDLLLVGMLARLFVSGVTARAGKLLGAGLLVMLISDVGYEMSLLGGPTYIVGLGRFALYTAAGLAALHPSMTELDRPAGLPAAQLGRGRLALLGIASMIAPAVLLIRMVRDGEVPDLTVVAVLSALTFLLVLARMADIMASHRLALGRERALREASAALVSAADPDQVAAAVRTAVAHLLPPDTPHGVVLAVTTAQNGPLSPEASLQAEVDRSAGTAARLVPTRDVDWAVSVRLANFPMTLRCPMVLADRPTGDPLVGVLHVAAPTPALPGLLRAIEVLATQAALALERIGLSQEVIRRNSETYFRTLVQKTSDVILIVDEDDRIRYASPSAATVLGDDPTGFHLPAVIHPDERPRLAEVLAALRAGDNLQDGLDFRGSGAEVVLEMHGQDLRADPTVAALVITLRDVTERRRLEEELTHRVFHDAMTGLANRVLFHDRLGHALARSDRDGSVVGVLFIDLDDFKKVNDTLGHAAGDQLLIGVANRIAGALRADDTAARLGGDEFAALVENVQDPGAVEETAQRILTALAEPITMDDGSELTAVASIGITTTPEADTADELLRQADLALYVAKGAGKNQWRRYQAHLHSAMVERLELRSALDHAVHEGHFLLAYQPIVDLVSDEAVGFEALVRWHHPTRGVIAPAEFLEVAEESGLVVPMGRWVLDQALHTVAQWWRTLPRSRRPYVSVNVSARQFREGNFVEQVRQSLAYAGVPPQALMLELSESLLDGEHDAIWNDLAQLRDLGIGVAIDDFGTRHSSPGDLRRRPIDVVKIDKGFADDTTLIAGLVTLARTLGLTVIAEGVESPAHRDLLMRLGCPLGQGYLLSSPLDGTEALSRMSGHLPLVA